MPELPSSSAQAAREAVAGRLRELMSDAQLRARGLALECGWSEGKSSRILNGKTAPSDDDIARWCRACGVPDQAADLIAMNRAADSAYVYWKKSHRAGMRRAQEELVPLFERTRLVRAYTSNVVPGMLQTPDYIRSLLASIAAFQETPDDSEDAAAARVARNHVVTEGDHRFVLLVEESVLRYRIGDVDAMAAQLGFLLEAMAYPRVSLGVIPFGVERPIWPLEAFYIFDETRVNVELLSAAVNITQPTEIAVYVKAFEELAKIAVSGRAARALIAKAIAALG